MNFKPLILLLLLIGCSSTPEQTFSTKARVENPEQIIGQTNEIGANIQPIIKELERIDWEAYQDSLRTELVKLKSNNFLIGSLLEELYIRNLVSDSHRELTFNIPLDLHGFDCGAPDCFSSDLTFSFPHDHQLVFPENVSFTMHEHGCVESELQTSGTMKLVEHGGNSVNYYSEEHRSNLVIIGNDERKEYVYYFTDVQPDSIKANFISKLISEFPEDDPSAIAPYRSTTMIAKEYERFLNKQNGR